MLFRASLILSIVFLTGDVRGQDSAPARSSYSIAESMIPPIVSQLQALLDFADTHGILAVHKPTVEELKAMDSLSPEEFRRKYKIRKPTKEETDKAVEEMLQKLGFPSLDALFNDMQPTDPRANEVL